MQTRLNVSPIDSDISQLESLEDLEIISTEEYDPNAPEASENDSVYRIFSEGVEICYKFVPLYPNYLISNFGQLINIKTEQQIGLGKNRSEGYFMATLSNEFGYKSFDVHQLVALAFLGPCPPGFQVDHISRDKTDNRATNLRYVSASNNCKNKTIYKGHTAEYFDQLPPNCVQLKSYGKHVFENYFINADTKEIYSFDNNQFRKVILVTDKASGTQKYNTKNTLGKNVSVCLSKLQQNEYNK
ncbi:HNH_endonuclease [Hexamita inflata]|uniref:HNH_endonuclease n=1 Tax=Hexamita inflata TaxID=28002 RepID=A0ABP1GZA6_9EUKA